jgi:serine/threonine protein kinase/formylglycine-generating enzyme required for sulfatase activity
MTTCEHCGTEIRWAALGRTCAACALSGRLPVDLGEERVEGETVGHFELVERLGGGAMGEVWLARSKVENPATGAPEQRALKFVVPQRSGQRGALDDLVREAMATANLLHRHLVRVYSAQLLQQDGRAEAFIEMQFIPGQTLQRWFDDADGAGFGWEEIRPLADQLLDGLQHAHRHGLVHLDLKPSNLMVRDDPVFGRLLVILDFGLARALAGIDGHRVGTPPYMSPAQWRGESGLDATDDLYAVGVLLYQLVSGRLPVEPDPADLAAAGDDAARLALWWEAVEHRQPIPLNLRLEILGRTDRVPRQVEEAIMACLQKEPLLRPASAHALKERLADPRPIGGWAKAALWILLLGLVSTGITVWSGKVGFGTAQGLAAANEGTGGEPEPPEATPSHREDPPPPSVIEIHVVGSPLVFRQFQLVGSPDGAAILPQSPSAQILRSAKSLDSLSLTNLAAGTYWLHAKTDEGGGYWPVTNVVGKTTVHIIRPVPAVAEFWINQAGATMSLAEATEPDRPIDLGRSHRSASVSELLLPPNGSPFLFYTVLVDSAKGGLLPGPYWLTVDKPGFKPETREVWLDAGTNLLELVLHEDRLVRSGQSFTSDAAYLPMVWLDAGTGLWAGRSEVSRAQFRRFAKARPAVVGSGLTVITSDGWIRRATLSWEDPGFRQGEEEPVVGVSWRTATAFCAWLTQEGRHSGQLGPDQSYRLPTDAEWSRLAEQAGVSSGNFAGQEVANGTTLVPEWPKPWIPLLLPTLDRFGRTAPVDAAVLRSQPLGFEGLNGNVAEWCADTFDPVLNPQRLRTDPELAEPHPDWRVVRGGSWKDSRPADLDPEFRNGFPETSASQWIGFRVVLSPTSP